MINQNCFAMSYTGFLGASAVQQNMQSKQNRFPLLPVLFLSCLFSLLLFILVSIYFVFLFRYFTFCYYWQVNNVCSAPSLLPQYIHWSLTFNSLGIYSKMPCIGHHILIIFFLHWATSWVASRSPCHFYIAVLSFFLRSVSCFPNFSAV